MDHLYQFANCNSHFYQRVSSQNITSQVLHPLHQQQRHAPQAFPPRGCHHCPEARSRGAQRLTRHALQQRHSQRPLAATATGVHGGVEADDVGLDPLEDQVLRNLRELGIPGLVNIQKANWKMAIEIVELPIKMMIFHSYVSLPWCLKLNNKWENLSCKWGTPQENHLWSTWKFTSSELFADRLHHSYRGVHIPTNMATFHGNQNFGCPLSNLSRSWSTFHDKRWVYGVYIYIW